MQIKFQKFACFYPSKYFKGKIIDGKLLCSDRIGENQIERTSEDEPIINISEVQADRGPLGNIR